MKKLIFITSFFLVVSCKSPEVITIHETKTKTVTETVHDTVFEVQADSSFYNAYIKCLDDKPLLTHPEVKPGSNLKAPKVELKDSILRVDCVAEAQRLFASWKAKHINTEIIKEVPVEVPRKLTFWQKTLQNLGWLFIIIVVPAIIHLIIKKFI